MSAKANPPADGKVGTDGGILRGTISTHHALKWTWMDDDGCIQCNCACLKMGDARNISLDLKSQWKIYDLMMNHGIIALCSNYM